MGYRTQYGGVLTISPPLTEPEHDRLLGLCKLDNPRSKDVFAAVTQPTTEDRVIIGSALEMLPWTVLFYEWRIGPCRKTDDHDLGECWTVEPPDSEIGGGSGDVVDELTFLHAWLKAGGHELAGELGWSGSDAGGDTGTIYVDAVHGVEAVEDVHENPGPSWASKAKREADRQEAIYQRIVGDADETVEARKHDDLTYFLYRRHLTGKGQYLGHVTLAHVNFRDEVEKFMGVVNAKT